MREFTEAETLAWFQTLEKRMSSASVALVTRDDEVLLVRPHYLREFSFPGGVVDKGESPRRAAVREVLEETGISLEEDELEFCLVADLISNVAHSYQFVFQATIERKRLESVSYHQDEIAEGEIIPRRRIVEQPDRYSQVSLQWAKKKFGYLEEVFGVHDVEHSDD